MKHELIVTPDVADKIVSGETRKLTRLKMQGMADVYPHDVVSFAVTSGRGNRVDHVITRKRFRARAAQNGSLEHPFAVTFFFEEVISDEIED